MVTIKDISRICGVSPATVSKALNGYDDISPETAELVLQTAKELNYTPNAAARLLKTNRSHNIGVLFIDDSMSGLTHEYFSHILNSVKEEAEANGYDITFISNNIGKEKTSFLQHCRYRNCDGVVIANVDFQNTEVLELVKSNVPVVTIDYSFDNASSVNSDNEEGSYKLTSNMIAHGHRKIAFIHGEHTLVTQKRISGYKTAMEDHGLEVPPEYISEAIYHDVDSVRKATAAMLDLPDPPTAILFPDDYAFMGGQAEILERGLNIPGDVSVSGYDGVNLAKILDPKLTTWEQDTDALGRIAVDKLIDRIENPRTAIPEYIVVKGKLFEGETVKQFS
ncbi:MAG: LacI family DNA-binding transcriptional regulator [Oscillospiraceae bacterium]|nr:LacI family DNA-binding transcriptional regulator [Oscillospiraceae bacterium]MBR5045454.1 LacI family DNA-binding transcriptional regulator [Oscillospiraceae bacterium]